MKDGRIRKMRQPRVSHFTARPANHSAAINENLVSETVKKKKKRINTENASMLKVEDFLLPGNSETEMIDYSSSIYSVSDIFSLEAQTSGIMSSKI